MPRTPVNSDFSLNFLEDIDDEPTQSQAHLESFLAELSADEKSVINVYREPRNGQRRLTHLFSCAPGEYTLGGLLGRIRDEFGGGEYRIHVRKDEKFLLNRGISIEAPKQPASLPPPQPELNPNLLLDGVQRIMDVQESRFLRLLERLTPQTDPAALAVQMLTAMAQFKEMMQPAPQPQQQNTESLLDTVKTILEIQSMIGKPGESNVTDVIVEAVKSFAPQFMQLGEVQKQQNAVIAAGQQNMSRLAQLATARKTPAPGAGQAVSTPTADATTMSALDGYLKQACNALMPLALQPVQPFPETIAMSVIQTIPAIAHEMVLEFLKQPNWIEYFANMDRRINDNEAAYSWFWDVRDAIIEQLEPGYLDQYEPLPPAETDNTGNYYASEQPTTHANDVNTSGTGRDAANPALNEQYRSEIPEKPSN